MILHPHYQIIKKYLLMVMRGLVMKVIYGKLFVQVEMIIG
jgi:hypothetical protein